MTFVEKKELVYQAYTKSLDMDIAFLKIGLSKDDKEKVLNDTCFNRRIEIFDAEYQESLITGLNTLRKSAENEGVKLRALEALGEMFYKKRFKDKVNVQNQNVPDTIIMEGISSENEDKDTIPFDKRA